MCPGSPTRVWHNSPCDAAATKPEEKEEDFENGPIVWIITAMVKGKIGICLQHCSCYVYCRYAKCLWCVAIIDANAVAS